MNNAITRENLQEKLENKHQNLLSQKQNEINKEIELILSWVNFSELSDSQKITLSESAKLIAENKHYPIDDKLILLENLEKNQRLNLASNETSKRESQKLYWDISNDTVYQRMKEKWDLENIKLFLERKLPLDVYYNYLSDDEIKDLWNENIWLLNNELLNYNTVKNNDNSDKNEVALDNEKKIEYKLNELLNKYKLWKTINIWESSLNWEELKKLVIKKIYRSWQFSLQWITEEQFINYLNNHSELEIKEWKWLYLFVSTDSIYEWIDINFNDTNLCYQENKLNDNSDYNAESEDIPDGVLDEYRGLCININYARNSIWKFRNLLVSVSALQWNIIDKLWDVINDRMKIVEEQYYNELKILEKEIKTLEDEKNDIEKKYPWIKDYFIKLNNNK